MRLSEINWAIRSSRRFVCVLGSVLVVVVDLRETEGGDIRSVVIGRSVVEFGFRLKMLCTNPSNIEFGKRVRCGRCTACRINRGQEWATRIMHEFDYVRKGAFLTLTYDDLYLPNNGSLVKAHLQQFIKKLRNYNKFKYYGVGEYGDMFERPHYHIIIIGGYEKYKDCWNYGFKYEGSVTWDSINYVTAYIQKKLYGNMAKERYMDRLAPFAIMSKGMGLKWLDDNKDQVYLHLGVRRNGKTVRAPRYYMKKIGDDIPVDVWNNRSIIMSENRDRVIEAEGLSPIELSKKDRASRHQKDVDLNWKKSNETGKGSF